MARGRGARPAGLGSRAVSGDGHPDPLAEDAWSVELTHAARRVVGWRFQGTTSGGQSLMFEIAEAATPSGWKLVRCYD